MNKNLPEKTEEISNLQFRKLTPYFTQNNKELSIKQRKFAYYYVMTDEDKYKAGKLAGYSEKGLEVTVCQLLKHSKIQEAIKLVVKNEIEMSKLTLDYNIFKKLKMIIEMDILDYLNEDGSVKKKLSDIPKPLRQLIKKTEVKFYGKDADVRVLTIEFLGKEWAFNTLIKYLNMIKDDNITNVNILTNETKVNLLNILQGE